MRGVSRAWDEALNAGKESVAIDLKTDLPFAQALARAAPTSILEGFRPGVAERLGVGPDDVPETAVYCSITGFGTDGPHAGRAGTTSTTSAGPVCSRTPRPGLPPLQPADLAAGALGAVAEVLAALLSGAHSYGSRRPADDLDDARLAPASSRTGWAAIRSRASSTGGLACYRIYATADGRHLTVGALEPKFFARLCELIDRPGARRAPVRAGGSGRRSPPTSEPSSRQRPLAEWLAALRRARTCASARSRRSRRSGRVRPGRIPCRPPRVGQHTDAWRAELDSP